MQRYKPGYTVPLRSSEAICNAMANTRQGLVVSTNPRELHSPDFTIEDVELLLEAEFDEYNNETNNDNEGAATSKKAALILMLGVLIPCYIITFVVHYWTGCKQGYDTSQVTEPESEIVIRVTGRQLIQLLFLLLIAIASTSKTLLTKY
ncbi:hypothetical protein SLEP1_g10361 [Rubroshorea leprosula]|uniref:Uncharacterized protein n=1 Tax=Rubroshorea leprosula TaxID=152421 RepID=A0AAV5IGE0_9ROSI|nr:hypothetical protein SLEP1_g10361 [Rubroshorea leprosula]